jgi:hypothetical protein
MKNITNLSAVSAGVSYSLINFQLQPNESMKLNSFTEITYLGQGSYTVDGKKESIESDSYYHFKETLQYNYGTDDIYLYTISLNSDDTLKIEGCKRT